MVRVEDLDHVVPVVADGERPVARNVCDPDGRVVDLRLHPPA